MFEILKNLFVIEVLLVIGIVVSRYIFAERGRQVVSPKLIGITLLTPIVGLLAGNVYIFYAYLVVVVAFNARSRTELAATYLAILPSVPALARETSFLGIYLATFSTILAMNFGALLGALTTAPRKTAAGYNYDLAVAALILIFMYMLGRDSSATALLRGISVNVISFAGPFLLISRSIQTREDVDLLMSRLLYGAVLSSVVAVFQAVRHWVVYQTMYVALHVDLPLMSWTAAFRGGLLRTGGSMLDYSAAGVFLAVIVCLLPFIRSSLKPTQFWVLSGIILAGLFATQSRGGWLAAVVGFVFMLVYRRRYAAAATLAAFVAAAEAVILMVATSGRLASILGSTTEATGTVTYRQHLASRGFEQIAAHPLLGQPPTQLVANLPDLVQGQQIVDFVNTHLFIAMAAGVPVFFVWAGIWGLPVVRAWRLRGLTSDNRDLAEIPAAIIIPTMVAMLATSMIDRNLVWPTVALGLAAPCFALAKRDRRARAALPRAKLVWGMPAHSDDKPSAFAAAGPRFVR